MVSERRVREDGREEKRRRRGCPLFGSGRAPICNAKIEMIMGNTNWADRSQPSGHGEPRGRGLHVQLDSPPIRRHASPGPIRRPAEPADPRTRVANALVRVIAGRLSSRVFYCVSFHSIPFHCISLRVQYSVCVVHLRVSAVGVSPLCASVAAAEYLLAAATRVNIFVSRSRAAAVNCCVIEGPTFVSRSCE